MEKNFFLKKKERSIVDQSFFFLSLFLFLFVPFFSFLSLSLPNFLKKKEKKKTPQEVPTEKKSKKIEKKQKPKKNVRKKPGFTEFYRVFGLPLCYRVFTGFFHQWLELDRVLPSFTGFFVRESLQELPSFTEFFFIESSSGWI